MTQHIFSIIWNERKINLWILIELILVFSILWFCIDYTYFYMKRYFEPKGFDIEHVYNVNLGMKRSYAEEPAYEEILSQFWTIMDRIDKYPEIESSCASMAAMPYSDSYSNKGCFMDTSTIEYIQIKSVTSGYFNVFKVRKEGRDLSVWDDASNNSIILSGDKDNIALKMPINQIKTVNIGTTKEYKERKIIGTAEPVKRSEFDLRTPVIYEPLDKNDKRIVDWRRAEISVRVKPEFEKEFATRFSKNMQEQLSMDPYYLSSVTSMTKQRNDYIKWNNYDNNFKSIISVSSFLLINIFLAVVGTFWFRIQARRSEIGLRIALGSSRTKVKSLFIAETLILLLLASIIATLISINISLIDILKGVGVPSINREENPIEISQYFANYGFTLLILGIISTTAVWYPANKAAKTQPAEALKDE